MDMKYDISRRGLLQILMAGAAAIAANGAQVLKPTTSDDAYTPAGHITADSAVGSRVAGVTLDGVEMHAVVECDDVEGWVRCLVDLHNPHGPRYEYRKGVVRVRWYGE